MIPADHQDPGSVVSVGQRMRGHRVRRSTVAVTGLLAASALASAAPASSRARLHHCGSYRLYTGIRQRGTTCRMAPEGGRQRVGLAARHRHNPFLRLYLPRKNDRKCRQSIQVRAEGGAHLVGGAAY